mmetsp:Transcript_5130/g.5580  ORF Transcript_5130/g.5580 Transcript_5130/m.5580 type:complete len:94 (+) Transcript_5130:34-315(+)
MSTSETKKVSTPKTSKKKEPKDKSNKKEGKEEKKHIQHGVPEGVKIEFGKYNSQPLEEQLFPQELEALNKLKKRKPARKRIQRLLPHIMPSFA